MIRNTDGVFPPSPPVEICNQARTHLWYQDHFGEPYTPLCNAREGIDRFGCKIHSVGTGLRADSEFDICTPCGLADIFGFWPVPNPLLNNRATHESKATTD